MSSTDSPSSSSPLEGLTQQQLIERLRSAEHELDAVKQQLRAANNNHHHHHSNNDEGSVERAHTDSELFPSSHGGLLATSRSGGLTPAQRQQEAIVQRHKEPYQVSFGVLVIEKDGERTNHVPLTTVINKSYLRPDEREADTPVVNHRDASSIYYENSRAFSAEMVARMGSMDGGHNSFAHSTGDHSPNATFSSSLGLAAGGLSSTERRHDSISAELLHGFDAASSGGGDASPMFAGQKALEEAGASSSLAVGLGVGKGLKIQTLDPNRLSRLHSVGPDALMTNNTLNVFKQNFGGYSNAEAMTPVCSSAMAVYNYMNEFAAKGFVHDSEEAKEGLGRMMQQLCRETETVLRSEPRHAAIESPAFVFGDIHGNFRDLHYFMKNLIHFGDLRYTPHRFMFLGDYVDRGEFSVEVIAYLFAIKVLAPEKVVLLRGNHEDTLVSGDLGNYGSTSFRAQCRALFGTILGEDVWNKASNAFASLPLTGNIDGKIFCTHGGLPRFYGGEDNRIAELSRPDYPRLLSFFQVPENETAEQQRLRQMGTDTCWADPADDERMLDQFGFGANPRGQGVILFGSEAVDHFLDTYGYEMIFRAHQEKADGLKLSKNARVFTIFSTSAYVGHSNGAGVVMVADGKVRLIIKTADNEDDEE